MQADKPKAVQLLLEFSNLKQWILDHVLESQKLYLRLLSLPAGASVRPLLGQFAADGEDMLPWPWVVCKLLSNPNSHNYPLTKPIFVYRNGRGMFFQEMDAQLFRTEAGNWMPKIAGISREVPVGLCRIFAPVTANEALSFVSTLLENLQEHQRRGILSDLRNTVIAQLQRENLLDVMLDDPYFKFLESATGQQSSWTIGTVEATDGR